MSSFQSSLSENKRLSILNFITNFGDWLSYFGFMYFFYESTQSVSIASTVILIKSGTILFANITFPYLLNRISVRSLVLYPQLFCGFIGILIFFKIGNLSSYDIWLIMLLTLFQSLFREIFSSARDTYSKYLRENFSHLNFQAHILNSQFSSQFLGPLFVLLTIRHLDLRTFVLLDTFTFLLSAGMAMGLKRIKIKPDNSHNLIAPFGCLLKNKKLLAVEFGRSVIFTISSSIENMAGLGLLKYRYGLHVVDDAWTYLANGLGATISSAYLKSKVEKFYIGRLGLIACLSFAFMGLIKIIFAISNNYLFVVILFILSGVAMGMHALTTQTLRSELTTNKEFPEIVALENIIGEKLSFLTQLILGFLFSKQLVSYETAMLFSGVLAIFGSLIYLKADIKKQI